MGILTGNHSKMDTTVEDIEGPAGPPWPKGDKGDTGRKGDKSDRGIKYCCTRRQGRYWCTGAIW